MIIIDLCSLPDAENTEELSKDFYELLLKQRITNNHSLLTVFNKFLGWNYYWLGFIKLLIDLLALAPPILLKEIVSLVEKEFKLEWFILYSGLLICSLLLSANLSPQYIYIF